MLRLKRLVQFAALVSVFAGNTGHAALVTVLIEGEIDSVFDSSLAYSSLINVGDKIVGSYSFDSTVADSEPAPSNGEYLFFAPGSGFSVDVADVHFSSDPNTPIFTIVVSNQLTDNLVHQAVTTRTNVAFPQPPPGSGGPTSHFILWSLQDTNGTALRSDALIEPPDLSAWPTSVNFNQIRFSGSDGYFSYDIRGHITKAVLIPEPQAAVWLALGFAAMVAAGLSRNRRRR